MSDLVYIQPPEPTRYSTDDGTRIPHWEISPLYVAAWPQGVEMNGTLVEDVDDLERRALSVLAAVLAHRAMRGAA